MVDVDITILLAELAGRAGVDNARGGAPLDAMELITTTDSGWPHVAWLSGGEVLALEPDVLALCLWRGSTTTANLRERKRALLQVVVDGTVHKLQLATRRVADIDTGHATLTAFLARCEGAKVDAVNYAEVLSGPRYRLHDPDSVVARWHDQLDALEAALADA